MQISSFRYSLFWDSTALSTTQTHPASLWVFSENELYSNQLELLRSPPPSAQDQCGTGEACINCTEWEASLKHLHTFTVISVTPYLLLLPAPTHFPFHILIFMLLMSWLLSSLIPNVRENMWHACLCKINLFHSPWRFLVLFFCQWQNFILPYGDKSSTVCMSISFDPFGHWWGFKLIMHFNKFSR